MHALQVLPPVATTRVSEHIPAIISFIEQIEKQGLCYATSDGSVLFDTNALRNKGFQYRLLEPCCTDTEDAAHSATIETEKRHEFDFALWKAMPHSPADRENDLWWQSPWGNGRPGWHIECSAMIQYGVT
jgi:cysteinyl-tRNA synthetase